MLCRQLQNNHLEGSLPAKVKLADVRGQTCPEGSEAANGTTDVMGHCELCHRGYYCIGNLPKGKDSMPCRKGTYYSNRGAKSSDDCTAAQKGFHCPNEHMKEQLPCNAGQFSSGDSFPVCIDCGEGFFSDVQASRCSACEAGYRCASATTSKVVMQNSRDLLVKWSERMLPMPSGKLLGPRCQHPLYHMSSWLLLPEGLISASAVSERKIPPGGRWFSGQRLQPMPNGHIQRRGEQHQVQRL